MERMTMHEPWCRIANHADAAKRLCDTYNLHLTAGGHNAIGKWFAASLSEGRGDDTLYDDKLSCVTHQHHMEKYYTFIKICPSSMNVCEAEVMLSTARRMYANGMRLTDPDHKHGGPDLITRLTVEDQLAMARGVVTNLKMPWEA